MRGSQEWKVKSQEWKVKSQEWKVKSQTKYPQAAKAIAHSIICSILRFMISKTAQNYYFFCIYANLSVPLCHEAYIDDYISCMFFAFQRHLYVWYESQKYHYGAQP